MRALPGYSHISDLDGMQLYNLAQMLVFGTKSSSKKITLETVKIIYDFLVNRKKLISLTWFEED